MGVTSIFFDTYAFCELLVGNNKYREYMRQFSIITTKLNIMEVHYWLLRNYSSEIADKYYDELLKYSIDIEDIIVKEANKWKLLNKDKKISYIDCIGYMIAQKTNMKFLTGDRQFENLPNVEFVK